MDGCWLNGEPVTAQAGGFYGGWITSAVEGPFKGDPNHPRINLIFEIWMTSLHY